MLNIIIDDFISSGNTVMCIYNKFKECLPNKVINYLCIASGFNGNCPIEVLITS